MTSLRIGKMHIATMFKLTVALLFLLVPTVALGASPPRGLVVILDGNDREARREIYDAIVREMYVEPPNDFSAALANEGLVVPIGDALATPRMRKSTLTAVGKAMRTVDASAVLSVNTKRKGATREAHVVCIVSTQQEPMIEEDFNLAPGESGALRLTKFVSASLPELARSQLAAATTWRSAAAAEPRSTAKPTAPEREASKSAKAAPVREEPPAASERDHVSEQTRTPTSNELSHANATWIFNVGLEWARRDLQYSDPWAGPLRSHVAPGMAVYSLGGELYPGATTGTPVMKDIGLVARFADSLPFETTATNGQTARGGFRRYAAGFRGRIRAGDKKESPLLGVEATYGMWQMAFTGPDQVVDEAPSVAYGHLRAGVDGRFPFGSFALLGGAGYMLVTSAGRFGDRFPHASVGGVDALLGGTWNVAGSIELKLLVSYARFFSSANPEPGDRYIAGGALDQYFTASFGASTAFR